MPYVVRVHHAQLRLQSTRIASRFLRKAIDDVHDIATRGARGGPYSTGNLARSIYKRGPIPMGTTVIGEVGSKLSYARIVERGAQVHNIFPKGEPHIFRFGDRRPRQLKFTWRGRVVYTPHVPMAPSTIGRSHPGQTGKHFLLKALVQTAAKRRMRITIYEV